MNINIFNIIVLIVFKIFRLSPEFNIKQFFSKWLSEINPTSELLNDTQFSFYVAGLYLSKIGDRSQQQAVLKLLNKKILLPLITYYLELENNQCNRFDLMKAIPTAASIQVDFFM